MIRLVFLRILESYFRHRWLYMLPLVLMMLAASIFVTFSKPAYVSRGSLYVRKESFLSSLTQVQNDGFVWNSASSIAVTDLSELIRTDAFVRAVLDTTGLQQQMSDPLIADELIVGYREAISINPLGENLIEISVTYDSPVLAQQLAESTVNVYKSWKLNSDQQESVVAQQFFADMIEPYRDELDRAQEDLQLYVEQFPDPVRGDRPLEEQVQIQQYQSAIDLARQRLQNALQNEEAARLAQSQAQSVVDQTYMLIDAPKVPTRPERSTRDLVLQIVIFIAVGSILSTVAIVGGALLDRSIHLPIDVQRDLHLPALAMVEDAAYLTGRGKNARNALSRKNAAIANQDLSRKEPSLRSLGR